MPDFGGVPEIIRHDDGGITCHVKSTDGEITISRYSVFPGIDLIYNNVHMPRGIPGTTGSRRNIVEIDHCRDGRLECCGEKHDFYLVPGDIAIHRLGIPAREEIFPTGHYHGITVQIDLECCPSNLNQYLEEVNVSPGDLAEKFRLRENDFFALRQMPSVEHIFSELYTLPKSIKKGYFKLKTLELLLFLSSLEPEEDRLEQRCFSQTQAILAQNVCSYLTEHLEQRITIAAVAEQFGVSMTQIKSSFDGVYGTSVYAYMRSQRMQAAAKLLQETDRTVLDIAGQFGYENGSKFASAFRTVMGVTPAQYRNGRYRTQG